MRSPRPVVTIFFWKNGYAEHDPTTASAMVQGFYTLGVLKEIEALMSGKRIRTLRSRDGRS
jgi:hypothetical protein